MASVRRFGTAEPGYAYRLRPAAYAVVLDDARRVACVLEESGLFLPGGGLEPGEDPAGALRREVVEECARALDIIIPLAPAIQFFRTATGQRYELHASFFWARFGEAVDAPAQHQLIWHQAEPQVPALYHECHRWAVRQALAHADAQRRLL